MKRRACNGYHTWPCKVTAHLHLNPYLLYGKASLRQIRALWSRSGFCSTDRFFGNGPTRLFLFRSKAGKVKICNQNSEKKSHRFSPGAPTRKRPKVEMSYGKRPARRREGAGGKAPECAISPGRWMGRQTRCLLSVLTKRAINSMKTGQFILNSQIYAQRVPPRIHRCTRIKMNGSQGHGERLHVTAPSENNPGTMTKKGRDK